jgi:hypothetical protein
MKISAWRPRSTSRIQFITTSGSMILHGEKQLSDEDKQRSQKSYGGKGGGEGRAVGT